MSSQPPNVVSANEILAGTGSIHPVIQGTEILGQTPGSVSIQPLTSLQRAGLWLAIGVGIFSLVALVLIMVPWMTHLPPMPDMAVDAQVLENYRTATALAAEEPQQWFDSVLVKILYPLFTLILGYIFGARSQGNENG